MSVTAGSIPALRLGTAAREAAAPPRAAPARAEGVELLGAVSGSGYRRRPALVRRADGQTVQLTPVLFALLEETDGTRSEDELATALGERIDRLVTAEDVELLLETKLRPLGLLRGADGAEPAVASANPLLALRLKLAISDPATSARIAAPFAALFHPAVVVAVLASFCVTLWWLAVEHGLASAAHQALYEPASLLLVFALTLASAGFHELGHAAACRYGGARPGAMGVGLYLVWPAFYTDVSDSYRLGRAGRLRVDLGGLYFNAVFGLAILGAWALVGWDALLLVIAAQLLQMLRQLIPVVRFDGYHVLADLTGVPDLFMHVKPTLRALVPTRRRRAEARALRPWARAVVTAWVLLVVPLLAALLAVLVLVFPRLAATAWDSLELQWASLETHRAAADVPAAVLAVLSMLMICLPVVGAAYLLARVVRRTARGAWRVTDGRPARRAGVVLAGSLVVVAVAAAWWPEGQYRPIEADEQWRLTELAHAAVVQAPATPPPPAVPPPSEPAPQPAATPPPAVPQPTPEPEPREPAPKGEWMLVLLPTAAPAPAVAAPATPVALPEAEPPLVESSAPPVAAVPEAPAPAAPAEPAEPPPAGGAPDAWPFPFEPPREPDEGDNQARAVNTADGTAEHEVALALVWVTEGGDVEHRNEAYALASCAGCRTRAVAFQVVLVIGHARVAAPVNAAVAVNHACTACVTEALAVQLVATLDRQPAQETMDELTAVWAQLEQESASFELRPLADVHAELLATRTRVLEILAADDGEEPTATTDVETGAATTAATTTTETGTAATTTAPPPTTTARTTTAPTTTTTAPTTTSGTTTASTTTTPTETAAATTTGTPEPPPPTTTATSTATTTTSEPEEEPPAGDEGGEEPPPPPEEPAPTTTG